MEEENAEEKESAAPFYLCIFIGQSTDKRKWASLGLCLISTN